MKNNSPSQRRYRARKSAEYFRKPTPIEYDFYKRRIGELCELFPAVFDKNMPLPLAVGIDKQLVEKTHFTGVEVEVLLRVWVRRWEYICMAVSVGKRYGLDGKEVGWIEASSLKGYIKSAINFRPSKLRIFCKRYLKATGRPGLICIPVNQRPDLGEISNESE